jgi:hypothetical protein
MAVLVLLIVLGVLFGVLISLMRLRLSDLEKRIDAMLRTQVTEDGVRKIVFKMTDPPGADDHLVATLRGTLRPYLVDADQLNSLRDELRALGRELRYDYTGAEEVPARWVKWGKGSSK